MGSSEKPDADFSKTDAVETDDRGRLRVTMETLQKSGNGESPELDDESGAE